MGVSIRTVGRSENPRGGADYDHHITNPSPGFSDLPTVLLLTPIWAASFPRAYLGDKVREHP